MLRLLLQPAARWLHRIQFEMERRANEWRSSARVSDGHEAAAHAAHAAHAGRLLMQVRDWAALTCLFVVKPNACQRPPQSQARIRPGAGVEPKGGVPVLESLQHPAWRAADPARGLAAADAACAGVPIRRRGRGPHGDAVRPGRAAGGSGGRRGSESSRGWRLRHGAWDLVALSGSTLRCWRVAVGADQRTDGANPGAQTAAPIRRYARACVLLPSWTV